MNTVVGMADLNVVKSPKILVTIGLGSCVGIALYDPTNKVAGLAHIMLPDSTKFSNVSNEAKFADTGIKKLISDMEYIGASKRYMKAKIAGGAQMFKSDTNNAYSLRVGEKNIEAVIEVLNGYRIPIISSDTGSNYGRTIEFYSEDGRLVIKTINKGLKFI